MNRIPSAIAAALLVPVVLAGCQTNPQTAAVVAQPDTPVVKNITSFSNSLRCMDQLFLDYGVSDIVLTSDGLPDATGELRAGTKDMMITTLSKMSERSGAFKFVDIHTGGAVFFLQEQKLNQRFATPTYYIRGGITQVDRNVAADTMSAGVAVPFASLGYSKDQLLSVVTLDVNLGSIRTRQILPGMHTTNTITVVTRGEGMDAEGVIEKASLFFQVSQNRQQGSHQAVRTLIELSLIETLGKFTKVPYWRCLELDTTDPTLIAQARGWYDTLDAEERVRVVQTALQDTGDYDGPVTGSMDVALRQAVNQYKARKDLIANGRIDFDLYYRLLADNRAVVPTDEVLADDRSAEDAGGLTEAAYQPTSPDRPNRSEAPAGYDPLGLQLRPVEVSGGYRVGDSVAFEVEVGQPAHVYCYYQYADGDTTSVTRIFPNRWQNQSRVTPGRTLKIPGNDANFRLVLDKRGVEEQVSCVAVERPYRGAETPAALRARDLEPIGSDAAMWRVLKQHREARGTERPSVQTVKWMVR